VDNLIEPVMRPWRLGAIVFVLFGTLALALAAFGLYGTLGYAISERTHELGVRIALGANYWQVVRLVMRRELLIVPGGIAAGLIVALLGGRGIAPLLFGVGAKDPAIFTVAGATIVLAALTACYAPVRRATRVDPMVALGRE
jgi:putative ABC transport system permease protein